MVHASVAVDMAAMNINLHMPKARPQTYLTDIFGHEKAGLAQSVYRWLYHPSRPISRRGTPPKMGSSDRQRRQRACMLDVQEPTPAAGYVVLECCRKRV